MAVADLVSVEGIQYIGDGEGNSQRAVSLGNSASALQPYNALIRG